MYHNVNQNCLKGDWTPLCGNAELSGSHPDVVGVLPNPLPTPFNFTQTLRMYDSDKT